MVDVAPSLYAKVNNRFNRYLNNTKIKNLKKKIEKGEATYKEANEYAVEVGEALKEAFRGVTAEDLPDGKMYYNIADRVVRPHMEDEYALVADYAEQVQKVLNTKAGLGLNAIRPEMDNNRIQGIIDRLSEAEQFTDVDWLLGEPMVNYSQSVVNDTLFQNAKLHNDVGLSPKIVRTAEAPGVKTVVRGKKRYTYRVPCKWCEGLAGVYDYEKVKNRGNNVYRQHENCRCLIEYDPGNGKRERVAGKYYRQLDPQAVERRQLARKLEASQDTGRDERIKRAEGLNEPYAPTIDNGITWELDPERFKESKDIIDNLASEYKTHLEIVKPGAEQAAGDVQIAGGVMRLNSSKAHTAIHEFGHTLAGSEDATKYGVYDYADFWKEIRKLRREYLRNVKSPLEWISAYEHSDKGVDEFLAEGFTLAIANKKGIPLPDKYGKGAALEYSGRILEIVDKYFRK